MNKLTYKVTHDFRPFRHWLVQAESEIEARMEIAAELGCELGKLEARLR